MLSVDAAETVIPADLPARRTGSCSANIGNIDEGGASIAEPAEDFVCSELC